MAIGHVSHYTDFFEGVKYIVRYVKILMNQSGSYVYKPRRLSVKRLEHTLDPCVKRYFRQGHIRLCECRVQLRHAVHQPLVHI